MFLLLAKILPQQSLVAKLTADRFTFSEIVAGDFDIAIIGMAGRFPGAADIDAFWENLVNGVEAVADFTDEEVLAAGIDPALVRDPHYVKRGGVLEGAELFDARFFGIYPREAEIMDPQHRVFLEVAWQALEHAGYDPGAYPGMISLFAGSGMNTYLLFNLSRNQEILETVQGYQLTIANDKDYLPTRVSYKLNLRGPSVNVQTACSTSLVATHLACQALLSFQCDMALAGGVTIRLPQKGGYLYQEGGIASPDGYCRAFDADAAGTVGGNGAAIVVLKRLTDAIADGDTIHAVIKGTAINNDGSAKVGYTAPSVEGQTQVIANAQALAGVDPRSITYIEAHGTGTALGDPIEITALTQVFRESTADRQFCAIGSVKSNVGHLDAAAGVTGLIKTALALKHKQIPPSVNYTRPNPHIDFASSPFYVNTVLREWEAREGLRRAGLSSFGIGGTNAHAVLEEAPDLGPTGPSRPWQLLVLSAKSEDALDAATANLAAYLDKWAQAHQHSLLPELADVAFTLQVGRQPFAYRRAVVAREAQDAVAALVGQRPARLLTGSGDPNARAVAFMFTGQGAQYANMAAGLYRAEPAFREHIDRCAELLEPHLRLDLRTLLYPAAGDEETATQRLGQTEITQPALFMIEYALAQLWLSWGIRPEAMIGHSIGEYVAACLAGVMSLSDALAAVAARGRLMGSLPGGAMLSLPMSEEAARVVLRDHPNLALASLNAPGLCAVAGPHAAVDALAEELAAQGVSARRLHTSHAFHSAMMDPILSPFTEVMRRVQLHPPEIPYISNVTGTWITPEQATDPAYYAQHLRNAVRFADGIATLAAEPGRALLEVGPGRTLTSLAKAHPTVGRERAMVASVRHPQDEQDDQAFILAALGQLWLAGIGPDWTGFYADEQRRHVPLPTYPFERQRYWVEPSPGASALAGARTALRKRSDIAQWFYVPSWRRTAFPAPTNCHSEGRSPKNLAVTGPWLIFAPRDPSPHQGAGGFSQGVIEWLRQCSSDLDALHVVYPGEKFSRDGAVYTVRPGNVEDFDRLFADLAARQALPAGAIAHLWPATDEADFERGQAAGFDSLIALARAWEKHGGGAAVRVCAATAGALDVTGDEAIRPAAATVLGACRVIPQEYPGITCRVVDIEDAPLSAEQFARELLTGADDPVVAYRGRHRWVQSFEPVPADPQAGRARLREGGVYLITGGLGRIGGVLAEHLAASCGARLALVDRAGLPPRAEWDAWLAERDSADPAVRKLLQIRKLEGLGAETLIVQADVADPAQMAAAVAEAEARFGALHGVIHAAGTVGDAAIRAVAETGQAERDTQFKPKVQGTLALAQALGDRPLDFVLLMSSISTVLGGLGFAAYAAANSFLDAFASAKARAASHPNQPWLSAAWDGWLFQEEAALAGRSTAADFAIHPAEGAEAFTRVLALADQAGVVISTGDLPGRLARWARPRNTAEADKKNGQAATAAATRHVRPNMRTAYVEPADDIERAIAADWENTLGLAPIGSHDDFFELGGHSLLATQLVSRLRDAYQVELPLRNLFETPTLAGLAALIRTAKTGATATGRAAITSIPRDEGAALPLSFGQQRLWFLDQLDPGSPLYNNFAALRMTGALDPIRLERSLNAVVARHEVLRAAFAERNGQPAQAILPEVTLDVPVTDLRDAPDSDAEIMRLAVAEAQAPFDLARGPLLRARLLRTGEQAHVLFFTMHHIVSDGWSVGVLIREVAELYLTSGEPGVDLTQALPPLPIQYADYAAWQRERLSGDAREAEQAYWRERLSPEPAPLALATDRPRPATQTFQGANIWFAWPRELRERVEGLGQSEGATLFMALLAGLQTLLYRYTTQEDICIGTPVANRDRAETSGLIGFLLNTLVLRADLTGQPTFRTLLARAKETALAAYAHQELPFELLVEALQPTRDMSRSPFFQVMFDMQAAPLQDLALPGIALTPLQVDGGTAKFDLAFSMEYGPDGLSGFLNYNTDLFDRDTAERMLVHLRQLLEAAVADPDRPIAALPMLTDAEARKILVEWNATGTAQREGRSVAEMFAAQVDLRPAQAAVVMADGSGATLTYAELDQRADQLARRLRAAGAGPDSIVALLLERSPDMIVAIVAALKAGAAFLPIDPTTPAERIRFMLEDSGARVLMTHSRLETENWKLEAGERMPAIMHLDAVPAQSPAPSSRSAGASPQSLAYIIYTSGSTGLPKGVMIEQGTLAQHLCDVAAHFELTASDRVLQFSAYTFDQGLEQILATLIAGGTLVVRGPEIWPPADFPQVLQDYGLSVINLPPAYWRQVQQEWVHAPRPVPADQLRLIISGGDVLTAESLQLWRRTPARNARLLNAYGPTEATVTATTFDVPAQWFERTARAVPIGRPLPNRSAYIVDPNGNPVPAGVPGELLLGGSGIARGYLNQPELTVERFVPNPFAGEMGRQGDKETGGNPLPISAARLYRTGDLARWLPDGNIEFLGRGDQQVKIRGFRVELGEIEAALAEHPAVAATVVALRTVGDDQRLVAYVVPARNNASEPSPQDAGLPSASELRAYLADRLPGYMVPAAFVTLDALPLNRSGKVDRAALPEPDAAAQVAAGAYVAPRSPVEREIAAIWADVLGAERVGIHDNFFDLGGHSLLATQILSRLRQTYPIELPLRRLFETPTVVGLAALVEESLLAHENEDQLLALLQELEGLSDDEARELLTGGEH